MRKYSKEEFVNLVRHLVVYFDVYNCVGKRKVTPDILKNDLMKHCQKPESTARSYVKKIKEDDSGLFTFEKSEDLIHLDPERVEDFMYNLEILLNIDHVTHRCTCSKPTYTSSPKGGDGYERT